MDIDGLLNSKDKNVQQELTINLMPAQMKRIAAIVETSKKKRFEAFLQISQTAYGLVEIVFTNKRK